MSTVITPFQGTDPFSTTTFNNRISQINTGFSYISNPNLLDNWYFGNPVNQRGQTSYVGAGYGIDRWFAGAPGTVVTVQSDHVSIAPPAGNYFGWINWFEADSLLGQTVTLSALCKYTGSGGAILPYITAYIGDNQYAGTTQINQTTWQCISFTLTFPTAKPSDGRFGFDVVAMQNFGVDIKAAKLELGSQQTLAHQDADGNWVLNEVPDYGEQLRRCQRYFVRFGFPKPNYCTLGTGVVWSSKSVYISVPLPNNLRAAPAITITGYVVFRNSDTSMVRSSATRLDALGVGTVLLYFNFAASDITAGDIYEAFLEPENYLDVSADL
nr:MAG TPA: hypothetical protein [Herelleviridae sp.]